MFVDTFRSGVCLVDSVTIWLLHCQLAGTQPRRVTMTCEYHKYKGKAAKKEKKTVARGDMQPEISRDRKNI